MPVQTTRCDAAMGPPTFPGRSRTSRERRAVGVPVRLRQGLAERRPDPTDRRAKLVAITDSGEAALDVANATRERLLKEIFGALSEADRETFLRLLDGLDEAARRLISASATDAPAVSA